MPFSVDLIRKLEAVEPQLREVLLALLEEVERSREESVTRKEFLEFAKRTEENFERVWQVIGELAQAQKRAEERLTRLEAVVEELAQAQKRTEERLTRLEAVVEELAQAQKRTEERLTRLEAVVEELAQAQKRTEERLTRLEAVVEELAQAQKRTEERLEELIGEHKKTRDQLGGLSHTVGYRLEDEAFKALPALLKRDYGLVVKDRLKRRYMKDNKGRMIEVNIVGEAAMNGKKVTVLGEGKSQLSKKDIDNFVKRKLRRFYGVFEEVFPVLVTYMISEPDVEEYAKAKGIALYYSYDF